MNEDQLRAFVAVAHHRSLSRAADELGLSQPSISERIRGLEGELGTRLVHRQGRGMALTPQGEAFLTYARRALDVMRQGVETARAVGRGVGGRVSVAVTVTAGAYLFAPALVEFHQHHVAIEVQVRSAHSWESTGMLLDGIVNLALTSGPLVHPQIETIAEFRTPLALVAKPDHRLARSPQVTRGDLLDERLLVSYWGPTYQRFLEGTKALRPMPSFADGMPEHWMELSPVELIKGLLLAGVGASIVPEIAVRTEIESGRLVSLALADAKLPDWQIVLSRRANVPANSAVDAMAATLVKVLSNLTG